jgi:hypothetical protein
MSYFVLCQYRKDTDHQQRVQAFGFQCGVCPFDHLTHEARRVKGGGGFKDDADLLPCASKAATLFGKVL